MDKNVMPQDPVKKEADRVIDKLLIPHSMKVLQLADTSHGDCYAIPLESHPSMVQDVLSDLESLNLIGRRLETDFDGSFYLEFHTTELYEKWLKEGQYIEGILKTFYRNKLGYYKDAETTH